MSSPPIYKNSKHVRNAKHLLEAKEADALARKTVYNKSGSCSTIFLRFCATSDVQALRNRAAKNSWLALQQIPQLSHYMRAAQGVVGPPLPQRFSLSTDGCVPVSSRRCAASETHASARAARRKNTGRSSDKRRMCMAACTMSMHLC